MSPSKQFRWQWRLSNGAAVEAVIDSAAGTETVSQGARILSKAVRGEKGADGHVVAVQPERSAGDSERPPIEAVVTFDPKRAVCILRVDGQEIAPSAWPMREAKSAAEIAASSPLNAPPIGKFILIGLAIVTLLVLGIFMLARRDEKAAVVKKLEGTYRAPNGFFVAHFPPEELTARTAVLPLSMGGVVLENKAHTRAIVIGALSLEGKTSEGLRDPWALQQRMHGEALVNIPKADGKYEETGRREDTCLGERGAVVNGSITFKTGQRARVWSCTFANKDAAYIFMYLLSDPMTPADEKQIRGIVDATDLTHLADLGLGVGNTPLADSAAAPTPTTPLLVPPQP